MSDPQPPPPQTAGLLGCLATIAGVLDEAGERDPMYLSTTDKATALTRLSVLTARMEALRLQVIAVAGDVADVAAHRDVASWLAAHTRADRGAAARDHRLAHALDGRWHAIAKALADGRLTVEQAAVIVRALDQLPSDLDPEVLDRAQAHLIEQAGDFGPRELRILGRRVLEVIAPEIADDHEHRLLEAEERHARRSCRLTTTSLGDGTTRIIAQVPDPVAQRLLSYLEAYAAPRRGHLDGPAGSAGGSADQVASGSAGEVAGDGERVPYDVRLGHAFCGFLEHADPGRLPLHGGDATTVVVTLSHQDLLDALGVATLPDGSPVTAGEARRLACTAGILPAVLGGDSVPLDLGRTHRLFSAGQRKALALRDKTCRAAGCDIPATWCEAHHAGEPWHAGGSTDLKDGLLLCAFHHHRAHDEGYLKDRLPNGDLRYHRRR